MVTNAVAVEGGDLKEVLEHLREVYANMLPFLAAVESLLNIPEEERYISSEWLERRAGE